MYIGNLILVFLNLPMVGVFVRLLRTPMYLLAPLVVMVCAIGVYSVRAEPLDLAVMVVAGAIGYVLRRFGYDVAPLLLAVVLGDRMESGIRTALSISAGDYMIFFKGPASQTFIALFATIVLVRIVTGLMRIGQAKK